MARRPPLTVFTPWYPSVGNPMLGSFVATWSRLASDRRDVRVVHSAEWPGGSEELVSQHDLAWSALTADLGRAGALDAQGDFGTITRVPNAVISGWDVPNRAEAMVAAVRNCLPPIDTPIVHGHVGYFGGLVAARCAPTDARVIVTEHSSELGNVLDTQRGLAIYREVLERANRLTCVSTQTRELILERLPDYAGMIEVLPNPVDYSPTARRIDRPESLDRWVFVGGLTEVKGVERLLEAFIIFQQNRTEATLDLFGGGPLGDLLAGRAAKAGIADRVRLHGIVAHELVLARLPEFDVLVGPSRTETFHLAVQEAIAAGLPVVLTRSGGPQEALGEAHTWCAQFVDVNDDAEELADGVLRLEERLDTIDLPRARAELSARLGPEAIRVRLAALYGEEPWAPLPAVPSARVQQLVAPPREVIVFARRTWRSTMVQPQEELAASHGAEVRTVGERQPKPQAKPLTIPQRALRKAQRIIRRTATQSALGGVDCSTIALLGDLTSAADVAAFRASNPRARIAIELDPTWFGGRAIDS